MKKCITCNCIKGIGEFHRNYDRCIECAKELNPEFKIKKTKQRKKLTIAEKADKIQNIRQIKFSQIYKELFPEKLKATSACNSLKSYQGTHKHHWSYRPEHWTDVIYLTVSQHRKVHYYIIYDQERFMFRDINGKLLASREEHLTYIDEVI